MEKYHANDTFHHSILKCSNCAKSERFDFNPDEHKSLPKIRTVQKMFCDCDFSRKSLYLKPEPKTPETEHDSNPEVHL